MNRRLSPMQIRRQAAVAIRNRVRAGISDRAPELREPDSDETPLSSAEIALGVSLGHIRALREGPASWREPHPRAMGAGTC